MTQTSQILAAGTGETLGAPGAQDRFMIGSETTGGRFSLVQHLLGGRVLAAPLHRHHREDEYTYVLSGRVGVHLGGDEVVAEVGDLVFKPRDQWHTFWNAGDEPATVLEIISPGGLECLFRELDLMAEFPSPEQLAALAGARGCDVDFDSTMPIVERHGLVF